MTTTPDINIPRLVVIDDTNPSIQYSPGSAFLTDSSGMLDGGIYGPVYNETVTGTSTNSSFTYDFEGTFIRVLMAFESNSDAGDWFCLVDNTLIPSITLNTSAAGPITNYVGCDSGELLSGTTGQHTLAMSFQFPDSSSSSSRLWLDSIQYQPLLSDPLEGIMLRIHNSDPSVTFHNESGQWVGDEGPLGSNFTFDTGASMSFVFNGTSVTLYGVDWESGADPTKAIYSLDESTDNSFIVPDPNATITGEGISNIPIFTVDGLSEGQHNLAVAAAWNDSINPQDLSVSYFIVKTLGSSVNTSGSQPNTTGSSSSDGSATESNGTHQSHVGLIVGSVLGGLFLLAILMLLLLFMWRRKIYSSRDDSDAHHQPQPSSSWWPYSFRTVWRSSSSSTFDSLSVNPSVVNPPFSPTDTSEYSSLRKSSIAPRVQHSSPVLAPFSPRSNEQSEDATEFWLPLSRGAADLPPSYTEH